MQSSLEKTPFPKTYEKVCNNLKNGLHWSGKASNGLQEWDSLSILLLDLYKLKCDSKYIHLFQKDLEYGIIKESLFPALEALRCILKDALKTQPKKKLDTYQFLVEEFPERSLLEFFAELGEEELFKITFKKLVTQVSTEKLLRLYKTMHMAYEGSDMSQALLLGFSQIKRGSLLYPKMWTWLWGQLQDTQRLEFMASFEKYMGRKSLSLEFKSDAIRCTNSQFVQQKINHCSIPSDLTERLADPETKDALAESALYESLYQTYVGNLQGVHVFNEIERYDFSMQSIGLAMIGLGIALATLGAGGIVVGMLLHFTWTAGLVGGAAMGMGTGLTLHGCFARAHEESIFLEHVISSAKI